jgi:hypothetical protein
MRDNEYGLSGTQFSTLNNAGINDPEGPEQYNNTEVLGNSLKRYTNIGIKKGNLLHRFN